MALTAEVTRTENQFTWHELLGFVKAFETIKVSNPKLSGKVDYWLNKNEKAIGKEWGRYLNLEMNVVLKHAKTKVVDGIVYLTYRGADDSDIIYNNQHLFYRLTEDDGLEKMVEHENPYFPTWEKEVPAAEGDEQPTKEQMRYEIVYNNDDSKAEFDKELADLQNNERFTLDLHKLKADNLEGVQMVWKKGNENLDRFRALLYDHCVID